MCKISVKKGILLLFILFWGITPAFATFIYGKLNNSNDSAGNISFVAFRNNDSEIVTEGVSGGNDYGALPTLTGDPNKYIWYFQENSFKPDPLAVNGMWSIYFYNSTNNTFGVDSGKWTGGNLDALNTNLGVLANPAPPEVILTPGNNFIGFHLPTDSTVYRIYRSENPFDRSYVKVTDQAGAWWKDTTAQNGKTYYYVVVRQDSSNGMDYASFSGHSERVNATPGVDGIAGAPAAPTALTATPGNISIGLNWPANNKEDDLYAYEIYRGEGAASTPNTKIGTVYYKGINAVSYSYLDLTVFWGKTYTYSIKAVDFPGNASGPSNIVSSTPLDTDLPTATITSFTPTLGFGTLDNGIVYTTLDNKENKPSKVHLNITGSELKNQQSGINGYKAWVINEPQNYTEFEGGKKDLSQFNQITLSAADVYGGVSLGNSDEGPKTVNVKVIDHAANLSPLVKKTAWLDFSPPGVSNVILNNNAPFTNSNSVSLSWTYADNCDNKKHCIKYWWDNDPEPASASTQYLFSPGNTSTMVDFPAAGVHTLHLKVIDLATNTSVKTDSNTVTYDTIKITGTITINADKDGKGALATTNLVGEVQLTLGSNKENLEPMRFISNNIAEVVELTDPNSSKWELWNKIIEDWTLKDVDKKNEFKYVYLKLKDPAGNISDVITGSIYYGDLAAATPDISGLNIELPYLEQPNKVKLLWTPVDTKLNIYTSAAAPDSSYQPVTDAGGNKIEIDGKAGLALLDAKDATNYYRVVSAGKAPIGTPQGTTPSETVGRTTYTLEKGINTIAFYYTDANKPLGGLYNPIIDNAELLIKEIRAQNGNTTDITVFGYWENVGGKGVAKGYKLTYDNNSALMAEKINTDITLEDLKLDVSFPYQITVNKNALVQNLQFTVVNKF